MPSELMSESAFPAQPSRLRPQALPAKAAQAVRSKPGRKSSSRRKPRIELRAIEVFVVVAETGNMTTAASRLSMTQPAVSQILGQLEKQIGSPLLDRGLRPLRLTPAGAALFKNAKQLLHDAERLCRAAQMADQDVLPRLRIGLVESFSVTAGPQLIKALRRSVDQLLVLSDNAADLGRQLMSRDLDLILSPDGLEGIDGIERKRVLRETFIALLPRSIPGDSRPISLQELASRAPMIRFSLRSHLGALVERHLRWQRVEVSRHLELDSTESVLPLIAEGVGWTIVPPLCLLQAPVAAQKLKPVPLAGPELARNLYLISRTGEFDTLPERVHEQCSAILSGEIGPRLQGIAPWLMDHFRVS